MGRDHRPVSREGWGTVRSRGALKTTRSRALSYLRTPRVIAVLIAFVLSGAGLALLLTGGPFGPASTTPVTGSAPRFTTTGDRWTLDQVLGAARSGDIDAISAMTPANG